MTTPEVHAPKESVRYKDYGVHRHDIDGLRAFAVLPVIAFHFVILRDLSGGGFVGVDIFFVISGYLITDTIYRDINNRTHTIVDFYQRRILRIFPALFIMFVFCLLATFVSNFPSEAEKVSESIIASIFFVSNFVFYSQSGYFDRTSEINPLLHMWSLSVEEQFYVIFPIVIYFLRAFSNKVRIRVVCAIALVSFLYSGWMVYAESSAAFFLVQFRAWELLIGTLLAINAIPKLNHRWQAELIGLCGIALIVLSVFLISKLTPFPGLGALAPCLGAAAVIHSGGTTKTLTARMLAVSPIRFIGLISYSLYLWHWPVIVFYRLFVNEPSNMEKGSLVVACILVATFSWSFIEQPFRSKPYKLNAYGTLVAGGVLMVSVAGAAFALSPLIETVYKYPHRAKEVLAYAKIDETHLRVGTCFMISSTDQFRDHRDCLQIKPKRPNFLILGDSHAADLWLGLQTSYPTFNFLQATAAGCAPIIGQRNESAICAGLIEYIFETFLPHTRLDGIILSARWTSESVKVLPEIVRTAKIARSYADRVIIFGPIIEYDQALPRILARAIALTKSEAEFAERHRRVGTQEIDGSFSEAFQGEPIEYVSIYRTVCTKGCEIWATKKAPLQFDNSHLTCEGSIELARKIGPQLFPDIPLVIGQSDRCRGTVATGGLAAVNAGASILSP